MDAAEETAASIFCLIKGGMKKLKFMQPDSRAILFPNYCMLHERLLMLSALFCV